MLLHYYLNKIHPSCTVWLRIMLLEIKSKFLAWGSISAKYTVFQQLYARICQCWLSLHKFKVISQLLMCNLFAKLLPVFFLVSSFLSLGSVSLLVVCFADYINQAFINHFLTTPAKCSLNKICESSLLISSFIDLHGQILQSNSQLLYIPINFNLHLVKLLCSVVLLVFIWQGNE